MVPDVIHKDLVTSHPATLCSEGSCLLPSRQAASAPDRAMALGARVAVTISPQEGVGNDQAV